MRREEARWRTDSGPRSKLAEFSKRGAGAACRCCLPVAPLSPACSAARTSSGGDAGATRDREPVARRSPLPSGFAWSGEDDIVVSVHPFIRSSVRRIAFLNQGCSGGARRHRRAAGARAAASPSAAKPDRTLPFTPSPFAVHGRPRPGARARSFSSRITRACANAPSSIARRGGLVWGSGDVLRPRRARTPLAREQSVDPARVP